MQRLTNPASPVWAAARSVRPPGRSWLLGLPWAAAAFAVALAVLLIQPPGTATAGHGQPGNQAERITFTYLGGETAEIVNTTAGDADLGFGGATGDSITVPTGDSFELLVLHGPITEARFLVAGAPVGIHISCSQPLNRD